MRKALPDTVQRGRVDDALKAMQHEHRTFLQIPDAVREEEAPRADCSGGDYFT